MPENEPNGAPAAPGAAGQQPTPNGTDSNSVTTSATDPATTTPAAPGANDQPASPEVNNPAAQKAAQEAARYRAELRDAQKRIAEFEAAQKAADDAKLSETERLQKQLAEAQAREAQQTLATQERITRAEVRAEAVRLGLNPQLAARIVDYAAITFDEATGDPTNIAQLLGEAINAYGLQPQPATTPQAPAAPQVGATNPARQAGPVTITASQYSDPAFRSQYMRDYGEDILTAMNKGKVKLV